MKYIAYLCIIFIRNKACQDTEKLTKISFMLNGEYKQLKLIQEYYAIYQIKSLYNVFEDFT